MAARAVGRPVKLIYYDDQSNPSLVPAIYTKLLSLDKVDLLLGPYGTNFVAPVMPPSATVRLRCARRPRMRGLSFASG